MRHLPRSDDVLSLRFILLQLVLSWALVSSVFLTLSTFLSSLSFCLRNVALLILGCI